MLCDYLSKLTIFYYAYVSMYVAKYYYRNYLALSPPLLYRLLPFTHLSSNTVFCKSFEVEKFCSMLWMVVLYGQSLLHTAQANSLEKFHSY